jgi:hypothetical protein
MSILSGKSTLLSESLQVTYSGMAPRLSDEDHSPPLNPSLILFMAVHIDGAVAVVIVEMSFTVVVGVFVFGAAAENTIEGYAYPRPFHWASGAGFNYFYCKHKNTIIDFQSLRNPKNDPVKVHIIFDNTASFFNIFHLAHDKKY